MYIVCDSLKPHWMNIGCHETGSYSCDTYLGRIITQRFMDVSVSPETYYYMRSIDSPDHYQINIDTSGINTLTNQSVIR
jgi:hypothetical protein